LSMPIYFVCGDETPPTNTPTARLGFRFAEDYPSLLAPPYRPHSASILMVLQDDTNPTYGLDTTRVTMIRDICITQYSGLVCDFEGAPTATWDQLIAKLDSSFFDSKTPLWIPEAYAPWAPHSTIMVSSQITGGTLEYRLKQAVAEFGSRVVLQILPIYMEFTLPCKTGSGTVLTEKDHENLVLRLNPQIFFSQALQCNYFGYLCDGELRMVLSDDFNSIQSKLHLSAELGLSAAIGLYQELSALL